MSACPHCLAGEPSVWDDVLFHYAHPDEKHPNTDKLKMCHDPWRERGSTIDWSTDRPIDEQSTLVEAADAKRDRVDPADILKQRELGWPDFHPEDYCHRCGGPNMCWVANQETWLTATAAWAAETGREGICCPQCFAKMHEAATGKGVIWELQTTEEFQRLRDDALGWKAIAESSAHELTNALIEERKSVRKLIAMVQAMKWREEKP